MSTSATSILDHNRYIIDAFETSHRLFNDFPIIDNYLSLAPERTRKFLVYFLIQIDRKYRVLAERPKSMDRYIKELPAYSAEVKKVFGNGDESKAFPHEASKLLKRIGHTGLRLLFDFENYEVWETDNDEHINQEVIVFDCTAHVKTQQNDPNGQIVSPIEKALTLKSRMESSAGLTGVAAIENCEIVESENDRFYGVLSIADRIPREPLHYKIGEAAADPRLGANWIRLIGQTLDAFHQQGIAHGGFNDRDVRIGLDGEPVILYFGYDRIIPEHTEGVSAEICSDVRALAETLVRWMNYETGSIDEDNYPAEANYLRDAYIQVGREVLGKNFGSEFPTMQQFLESLDAVR